MELDTVTAPTYATAFAELVIDFYRDVHSLTDGEIQLVISLPAPEADARMEAEQRADNDGQLLASSLEVRLEVLRLLAN